MTLRIAKTWVHACVLAAGLIGLSQARAAERVALVIGNSAYEHLPRLTNPVNDATDVSQSLERLGFKVTTVKDAGFEKFRLALREFGRAAVGADIAIIFYAGHGMEVAGENWLLPVDGELKSDIDVNTEAASLRAAMLTVSEAKSLGLVILDACRNNAFANVRRTGSTRSANRGLAPIDPTENVLVAYAARDGTTASDGTGRNSPFTAALLRHLETPGLEVEFLFRNVRDDVWAATNGGQQPFLYGSLSKDEIYLNPAGLAETAVGTNGSNGSADLPEASDIAWSFLRTTFDAETLRRFAEQFPKSNEAAAARQRIAALESVQTSSDARPNAAVFNLASDDAARIDDEAVSKTRPFRRTTPAVEAAWNVVKDTKDVNVIKRFADRFPSRRRRIAVESRPLHLAGARIAVSGPQPSTSEAPKIVSRDVLLQAAEDKDVIGCFQIDDISSSECRSALERYPLISYFSYDYRFRFTLCQALGDVCGGKADMLRDSANLQAKALFNPTNTDPVVVAAAPAGVLIAPNPGNGTSGGAASGSGQSIPSAGNKAGNQAGNQAGNPPAGGGPPAGPPPKQPRVVYGGKHDRDGTHNDGSSKGSSSNTANSGSSNHASNTSSRRKSFSIGARAQSSTSHKSNYTASARAHFKLAKPVASSPLHLKLGNANVVHANSARIGTAGVSLPGAKSVSSGAAIASAPKMVNIRVVGTRVPTVKVPTVTAPTVRVPTVRVPTIRVPTVHIR